jgi:hypothetical protein
VLDGDKETLVALAQGTINRVGDGTNGNHTGAEASAAPPATAPDDSAKDR